MSEYLGMDNRMIHVIGGWSDNMADDLHPVLTIAFHTADAVVGWSVKNEWLLLHWYKHEGVTPLLAPVGIDGAHALVVGWLKTVGAQDELNDSDVWEESNGFEAKTNMWGHGLDDSSALLAIKPRTRWLGK